MSIYVHYKYILYKIPRFLRNEVKILTKSFANNAADTLIAVTVYKKHNGL